jgi:acetoacetyl-CoA synthetase
MKRRISTHLRREGSPRHVPDEIVAAPGIPYMLTGKKMEIPIRKLLSGLPSEQVADRDTMTSPELLDWYGEFAQGLAGRC